MSKRLGGLLVALIVLNLALMAVDALVLPGQGFQDVMPVNQPPRGAVRPPPRPNQLDLLLGRLMIRPVELERPQPGLRPQPAEPRSGLPARPETSLRPFSLHQSGWQGMALHLVGLLALLSTSVVLAYFLPGRFKIMRDVLRGSWPHTMRTLAIGIFGYLGGLLLAFMLAIVVSGLVYAVLVLAALVILAVIGVTTVSLALGRWLASLAGTEVSPLFQLLLGVLLAFPLTILPYFGWVAAGILASFGMGAILLTRMGSDSSWSLEILQ